MAVKFDRSKFKVNVETIQEVTKKAQATMPKMGNWVSFVTPEEGKNYYRVLPAFQGSPYVALKTSKLDCKVPVYDKEGSLTGEEVKSKNVYCADIHGADILNGMDPIVTYIRYVRAAAEEIQDKNERDSFLAPITGYKTKKGEWVWGIEPMLNFVCYVLVDGEIQRLQLRPAWMKEMKNLSVQASEDESLSLDIFSDADAGHPLCINKYKENKKTKFDLSAVFPKKSQSWDDFFEENKITDAVLEKLSAMDSLEKSYVNVYKKKDWDLALDGLQRFDEANGYNIFADDEFLNELAMMAELVPEEEVKEVEEKKTPTRPASNNQSAARSREIKKPEAAESATKVSQYPPLIKIKSFLKEYIETEYEGSEELPESLTIAELREWYDLANEGKMLPFDDYRQEAEEEAAPEPEEESLSPIEETQTAAGSDKLAAARERLKNLRK